ncbi:hypothetical protein C8R44DRAFT_928540 [Mycena epipterygia]|nr:hypothetical protein C8R44DRAFT_928540 [Mycena epipterygia]
MALDISYVSEYPEDTYDDSGEAQDIDIKKILNHPVDEEPLDFAAYALPSEPDADAPKALPAVEGVLGVQWNAHSYWKQDSLWPTAGIFSIALKPSSTEGKVQHFTGSSRANRADFKIAGECHAGNESGTVEMSFTRSFRSHSTRLPTQYYAGVWNASTDTISGTVGFDQDPATHHGVFVFKRMPPENMCFLPAPVELQTSKARALWGFAIAAVIQGVRRDRWSWSFFKERRDNRRRFIELYIRSGRGTNRFGPRLTNLEEKDFARVKKSLTTQDSRFYHSLGEGRIRAITDHGEYCRSCEARIGGARITCLECQMKKTVDFCELPDCITSRVNRDDMQKPHLPHHDLMKVRRVVHTGEFDKIYRNAKEALQHARTFFKSSADGVASVKRADDSENEVDTEDKDGRAPMSAKRLSRIPTLAVSIPQSLVARRGPASGHPMSAVSPSTRLPDSVASGPRCCGCSKPVTQPCWYCVHCVEPSFICWECDAKGELAVKFGEHNFLSHGLVRVLVVEKDLSIEERFMKLDARFGRLEAVVEGRMVTMDDRFGRLEGRMVTMEKLLEQVLTRLS